MQSTKRDHPPWLLQFRSSTVFIIATVWIASFTDYFLYAMVVPILPTALVERANVPYEDREYWVSVLLMCEAATAFICCPIFGYIVDIAPTRRLPYVLGLVFLGVSMGLLAAARSTVMFVAARLLQGGATAMVAVAGFTLLTDSVPLDNLGQTIGYQGSAIALGFLLGPLLGGIVYDAAGYLVVFAMTFSLVGVDLIMRVALIEKKVAQKYSSASSSSSSSTLSTTTQSSGYQTFTESPQSTESETETGSIIEHPHGQGQSQPTLLRIAKQPRVVISSFGLLVQGLLWSAFDATIPIFVETHFNWTPLGAGLVFLPSALTALFEPFFGYISDHHGTRPVAFTSFILLPIPLACLSLISSNTPSQIFLLVTFLTLIGLLVNLGTPALFVETQEVLEKLQPQSHSNPNPDPNPDTGDNSRPQPKSGQGIAQAFGIQTMAQFLGMFLGSFWGGFMEWRFGWAVMVVSLGGLCVLTAGGMLWLGENETSWFPCLGWTKREKERVLDGGDAEDEERERLWPA